MHSTLNSWIFGKNSEHEEKLECDTLRKVFISLRQWVSAYEEEHNIW